MSALTNDESSYPVNQPARVSRRRPPGHPAGEDPAGSPLPDQSAGT